MKQKEALDSASISYAQISTVEASLTNIQSSKSADGRFTASGHQSGSIYIFSNDTGRMLYSLSGAIIKEIYNIAAC